MRWVAVTIMLFAGLLSGCGGQGPKALSYRVPMLAYSPYHGDSSSGCPSAAQIQDDFTKMHGISETVRIYGLRDCEQGAAAMQAATALGMRVNLGLWLAPLPADADGVEPAAAELQRLGTLLDQYGADHIDLITVGNETQRTTTVSEAYVLDTITQVRALLSQRNLSIPVTTAQVLTDYTDNMVQAVDLLLPNIHPYWAGIEEEQAANWVVSQVNDLKTKTGKPVEIGETGWPTAGDTEQSAVPSSDSAGDFLVSFYCAAQATGLQYTYFEAFDLPPNANTAQVEAHWGLMDESGALKSDVPKDMGCFNTSTKALAGYVSPSGP